MRLPNMAHLLSRIDAEATHISVLELASALHPSPAVCGLPVDDAMEFLCRHELFDRGWYAGPVGWVCPDGDGTLFVALRSLLLKENAAYLFAGSGIVNGSTFENEEQETLTKLKPALQALGIET